MNKLLKANINEITMDTVGNGQNFSAKSGRFTTHLDMRNLGCGIVELEPGQKAWPYHLHLGTDEMFYIVSGSGSIRYNDETYPIKEGDVIYTPAGEETAHQIINNSNNKLRYLAINSVSNPDICYYPDSGKYGSYTKREDGSWKSFIAHESSVQDYFEGEND